LRPPAHCPQSDPPKRPPASPAPRTPPAGGRCAPACPAPLPPHETPRDCRLTSSQDSSGRWPLCTMYMSTCRRRRRGRRGCRRRGAGLGAAAGAAWPRLPPGRGCTWPLNPAPQASPPQASTLLPPTLGCIWPIISFSSATCAASVRRLEAWENSGVMNQAWGGGCGRSARSLAAASRWLPAGGWRLAARSPPLLLSGPCQPRQPRPLPHPPSPTRSYVVALS
jgi:hypothetical protein